MNQLAPINLRGALCQSAGGGRGTKEIDRLVTVIDEMCWMIIRVTYFNLLPRLSIGEEKRVSFKGRIDSGLLLDCDHEVD